MALKKKYIKAADGDFKKAWRLQRAAQKGRKTTKAKSKKKKKGGNHTSRARRKIPLGAVLGLGMTASLIYSKYNYLARLGNQYEKGEALWGAMSGMRKQSSATGDWAPVGWDTVKAAVGTVWAPGIVGVAASKFVGGGGTKDIPGMRLNQMIPLPIVKI